MARFEFNEAQFEAMTADYGRQARHHFADPIVDDAKLFAPDDPTNGPGPLRLAIGQDDEDDTTYIGAELKYAAPQEEGSKPHRIPGAFGRPEGVEHPGNEATNYLKRALYQRRDV